MATDIRGPWHDEVRVTLTSLGATALQDDDREAVRRVIEALRLGESFDLYRQAVEDGSEVYPGTDRGCPCLGWISETER